ncbi:MAG TPA: AIR carboxylase family protein [Patescibacteria group bacterium]
MSAEQNKEQVDSKEQLAVILMGSEGDIEHVKKITKVLKELGVKYESQICSADKTTLDVLKIIDDCEFRTENIVFIAVAGRANALGGVLDGNTVLPVVSCPPIGDKFAEADLFSSLRKPSGVSGVLIIDPEGAALFVAKMFALNDSEIEDRLITYRMASKEKIREANKRLQENGL